MTVTADRSVDVPPMTGCPTHRHPRAPRPRRSSPQPPQLADGVQLLGEYAGTGYKQPQYLARLAGGQLVQLSQLLHLVAEQCDGTTSSDQIATRVSAAYGKRVSPRNVSTLVGKLRPLGVLARPDGTSPPVESSDPLLGLKLRTEVLSPRLVRRLAAVARPLFWPPLVLAVVLGLVAVDVWLFFVHGVGDGVRSTVEQPVVFLLVAAVVVVTAGLHEFGHAAACAYGGAKPGGMGAGIYVVWPAFYTDVTEAYRLDKRGRLRTDLGGVYVNAVVVIAAAAVYAATQYEPLVLICFVLQIQVLQQMLPFLRLDGYYVVSDLVGVPDLFRRIGPVLRSAIPFRPREPEVEELKPWVRRVIAGWVFVLVPVLALNLGYFVLSAPRIAATSWDSAMRFLGRIPAGGVEGTFAAVQLLLLLLPTVGITYTAVRFARRGAAGAWSWSAGSLVRRLVVLAGTAAMLAGLLVAWFPDARLTPYREGERDTAQQHVRELRSFRSGSPLLRAPTSAQTPLPAVPRGSSAVDTPVTPRTELQEEPSAATSARPAPTPAAEVTSGPSSPASSAPESPTPTTSAGPTPEATRRPSPAATGTSPRATTTASVATPEPAPSAPESTSGSTSTSASTATSEPPEPEPTDTAAPEADRQTSTSAPSTATTPLPSG